MQETPAKLNSSDPYNQLFFHPFVYVSLDPLSAPLPDQYSPSKLLWPSLPFFPLSRLPARVKSVAVLLTPSPPAQVSFSPLLVQRQQLSKSALSCTRIALGKYSRATRRLDYNNVNSQYE